MCQWDMYFKPRFQSQFVLVFILGFIPNIPTLCILVQTVLTYGVPIPIVSLDNMHLLYWVYEPNLKNLTLNPSSTV